MILTELLNPSNVVVLDTPHLRQRFSRQIWSLANRAYAQRKLGLAGANLKNLVHTPGVWKLVLNERGEPDCGIIYREFKGLKLRLVLHGGSVESKIHFKQLIREDVQKKVFWCEVSGAVEQMLLGYGIAKTPNKFASELLEKPILSYEDDGYHYTRDVYNGTVAREILLGYPKV